MAYVFEDAPKYVFEDSPRYVFEEKPKVDISDISPLPETDVSLAAPKAAASIAGGAAAFPVSGIAGLSKLITTGSLEEATKTIEGIGGLPSKIADDKASQELTGELMKPVEMVEFAAKTYGDWVEKNWPDRDEASDMGALTKSIVEGTVFVVLPGLKAKLIKNIKAKDIPKIKETLDRIGLEKTPEKMAEAPETKFLKEEFQKRFVFEEPETPKVEPAGDKVVYRATDKPFDKSLMTEDGLFVAQEKWQAEAYSTGGEKGKRPVQELIIDKDAKVLTFEDTPKELYEKVGKDYVPRDSGDGIEIAKYAKENGYDAVEYYTPDSKLVKPEIAVVNPEVVKPIEAPAEPKKVEGAKPQGVVATKAASVGSVINKEIESLPPNIKGQIEEIKVFGSHLRGDKANDVDVHIRIKKQETPQDSTDIGNYIEDWIGKKQIDGKNIDLVIESDEMGMGAERGKGISIYKPSPEKPAKGKEAWEMTAKEFVGKRPSNIAKKRAFEIKLVEHKDAIKKALSEDKPVPPEVLKDYPDLQAKATTGTTLYSGIPIHKAGEAYTKLVGEPLWDKLIMEKVPQLLEKVPGGKAVNRAFIYDYRGDLKDTAKYIKSMEDKKRHQAIGREYGIDLGKRLQSVPEQSQLRIGEAIRGEDVKLTATESALADEAMWSMLELGKQAVDAGLLSEEAFFKNAGRYMPRLYTSKEYKSLLTQFNLTKPNRLDLSRFKRRKDIPKEVRKEMGEILTPGYPIAKGISQLTHDIEVARFFNGISKNPDWSLPKKSEVPIPEGWKQLPSNKKLGNLSESYVHPEIFTDIQETVRVIETSEKMWRKALGSWKFGKVIISPKTHVRNLMSNSVLAHLGGMPMYEQPVYLIKAAKAMKEQGEYWKIMRQEGGGQHTFTAGELGALFDQVESQMKGVKAGSLPDTFGIIGNAWDKSKSAMRKAADLYQAEEQWFKMAKFIHNIERKKMAPKQAWADAEKWLFDYSKVTRFQDKYRTKWYGAPFSTFTFKALPRIAEAMVKTPWRFALPGAIIYGLEKAAQRKIGDTKEEIQAKKELRPEWMKGTFLGIPNFARVPFIDEDGREYWLNLTYVLPWGDIGEQGKFGPIPGGVMPFSMPFAKEGWQQAANYDSFWKEEIVPETELAGKSDMDKLKTSAKLRGQHISKTILPTPVHDVAKIIDSLRNRPDYRGRIRPSKIAAADTIAGIKMYPVDYTEQVMRQIGKVDPNTGFIARKILSQIRTLAIKKQSEEKRGRDTEFYDKQIEEKVEQLKGLGEEAKEIGELYKKSKK